MYGGAAYNFCRLHAQPKQPYSEQPPFEGVILDSALSCIADTLILPYTTYVQLRDGSMPL
ncbi:YceK/YidQ family lipoprotein [Pseudomonas sp. KNUC1026]|uniref:YceK/YidQ family lipoprotein n=1 Tax=Pseudomonas sp. KNUC1026 TaxID=2893890 RepID=UPI003FA7BEFA